MKRVVFFATLILAGCSGEKEQQTSNEAPPVMQVEVYKLAPEDIPRVIEVPGSIIPGEEVMLYNETNGRINRILFKEGQHVSKGQLLLELDTDILRAQRKQYQVDLALAQKDEARKKALLGGKAITLEEYEKSSSALSAVQAQIDLVNTQIEKASLRAPFSGRIGLRQVSEGAYITTSTPIASLVQDDPIKVEFSIPEMYAPLVKEGQDVRFTRERDTNEYHASVYAFEPLIDQDSRMFRIRAQMKNTGSLIPGAFVKVNVDLGTEKDAWMVPAECVIPVLKGQKVLVIRDGKVSEVSVETGIRTADKVQVSGQLKTGDTILTSGLLSVRPGMPVEIKSVTK